MINCHFIMLYMLYKQLSSLLMTGTSCAFLLTKSSDLPLYFFFLHICNYTVIYNDYHEAFDYVGGFDERCLRTYCKLKQVLMITNIFELCCRLRT
jgi:hypothetical protein